MVISSLRPVPSTPLTDPPPLPTILHPTNSPPDPHPLLTPMLVSAADCLHGVFLCKPPGRTALYRALSSTDLGAAMAFSPEVLANVVDAGDLRGAATVTFHWVITTSKPRPSVHTCNIVIRALGRKKFFDFSMAPFRSCAEITFSRT